MKKSFWTKKNDEMTVADSVRLLAVLYAMIIVFSAAFSLVMMKLEDISDVISDTKDKIKAKFSRKTWVGEEDEELE